MKTKKTVLELGQSNQNHFSLKETSNLINAFLLKGEILLPLAPEYDLPDTPIKKKFRSVKELEELVYKNRKTIFGQHVFMVHQQYSNSLIFENGFTPTGFLLDMSDPIKPVFYIIDILQGENNFYNEVFPKVTMFFSALKREENIEKLCDFIGRDKMIRKELLALMESSEITSYLKSAITSKPNVLLVNNNEMPELPLIKDVYFEKWQSAKFILMQKYASKGTVLFSVTPPFRELYINSKKKNESIKISEEYHFENATDEVKRVYTEIKTELLKVNKGLQFNPQKYYISLKKSKNLAFFHFSNKRITLVVMHPEKDTRKLIKHYVVKTLTEKVQKFWNGPSCSIVIDNTMHLQEVINLLKKLIAD